MEYFFHKFRHESQGVGVGGGWGRVRNAGDTRRADTVAIVLKFSLLECVIDEERRERIQDGGEGGRGDHTARRGA